MGRAPLLVAVLMLWALPAFARQPAAPDPEELQLLRALQQIETALTSSDKAAWMALVSVNADAADAGEFFDAVVPRGVTRAVVRERERTALEGALPGDGYRLIVDVFLESGPRGMLSTWRLDLRRPSGSVAVAGDTDTPWRIVANERLSQVDALHRLELNRERPFTARDFVLSSVDFELRLISGSVFVADTADGVTALVLQGDGVMNFHPTPKTERGQVRLFAGTDAVESRFDAAFVRISPTDFEQQLAAGTLAPTALDARQLERAREIFNEEVSRSFSLDLSDLSRDIWSILPQPGDMVAEVRTRKYHTLTYARTTGEPEDVTFFSRERKRNIAVYASPHKLESRGAFYNEDDLTEYDVLDYDIDVDVTPDREWLAGVATLKLRVKSFQLAALTLKLAENFTISSVTSKELGRLLFLRVRNQSAVVVNLPTPLSRDYELTLTVQYQGRMERQTIDSESVQEGRGGPQENMPFVATEPNWLLSNRAGWYPQSGVTDYATAALRVAVPMDYMVVASGVPAASPDTVIMAPGGIAAQRLFSFRTTLPVRYLGAVISRMTRGDAATVALDIVVPPLPPPPRSVTMTELMAPPKPMPVGSRNTVELTTVGNRRQEVRARDALATTADVLRFYASIMGDAPYPSFTVALVEGNLPGGHSPAYFAVLNHPLPTTPFVWRNDPATFTDFPEFILAHEVAHQWWGQAVGWKNYHEQWISEGFAQYFATLYARERRGDSVYRSALRNLRRWAMANSDQGPISLGYRLGHVKGEPRVFRAIVYNKGAMVLHMLRRLMGDEAFFKGLRRFYRDNRYMKAGTDDLQRAMEAEYGKPLERFFAQWVLDTGLPRVRYSATPTPDGVTLTYEQTGEVFDVPVTATLQYADGTSDDLVVTLSEAAGTVTLKGRSAVRSVDLNRDDAALGQFERK
ncbi:MAG: M1 family aminopeptidase [Acidobacteriota bacterium]